MNKSKQIIHFQVCDDDGPETSPWRSIDFALYDSRAEAIKVLKKARRAGYPDAYLAQVVSRPCRETAAKKGR